MDEDHRRLSRLQVRRETAVSAHQAVWAAPSTTAASHREAGGGRRAASGGLACGEAAADQAFAWASTEACSGLRRWRAAASSTACTGAHPQSAPQSIDKDQPGAVQILK